MINTKQSKKIHLDTQTLVLLEMQAAKDGRKLEKFIEEILKEKADKIELTDEHKEIMNVMLEKHEAKITEYTNWESFKKTLEI